jgi:tetrahydromethanopterin S-methyltransferase subunit G
MAHIECAFDQINERLGSIDRRLDAADSRFHWVIGTIVGTWLTMMATQITTILTIVSHR